MISKRKRKHAPLPPKVKGDNYVALGFLFAGVVVMLIVGYFSWWMWWQ